MSGVISAVTTVIKLFREPTGSFGATDTILNDNGGTLNDTNAATQIAASVAGLAAAANPLNPAARVTALTAGDAALSTGLAVLNQDIANNEPASAIIADYLTVIGDSTIIVGAVAPPGVSTAIEALGDTATLLGIGIRNYDAIVTNTPIAYNEAIEEILDAYPETTSGLASAFGSASTAAAQAWSVTSSVLSGAIESVDSSLTYIATSGFSSAVSAASSTLSSLQNSTEDLAYSAGATISSIAQTISGGYLILSGGSAYSLLTSALNTVNSGGTTDNLTVNGGGSIESLLSPTNSGAQIYTNNPDGTSEVQTFNPDGSSTSTYYTGSNGSGQVTSQAFAGGTVNDFEVVSANASYSDFVISGSIARLWDFGNVNGVTVDSCGYQGSYYGLDVYSGGTATNVTVNSAGSNYVAGGQVYNVTVNSGGAQTVVSGGIAYDTVADGGGAGDDGGLMVDPVYENGGGGGVTSAIGATVFNSSTLYDAGITSGTQVNAGGTEYVYGGAESSRTIVYGGGTELAYGTVSAITVAAGGSLITDGASVYNPSLAPGASFIVSGRTSVYLDGGGQITGITDASGLIEESGTFASTSVATTSVSDGAFETVMSGAISISSLISGGDQNAGGPAWQVLSGGIAYNAIVIGAYSEQEIYTGAASGTLLSGGVATVSDGYVYGLVNDGGTDTIEGGIISSSTINDLGSENVYSSGITRSTTVNSGGTQFIDGNNNYYNTSGDPIASNTTVNSGGSATIVSGGSAYELAVNGGTVVVSGGGTVSGLSLINGGAAVLLEYGSIYNASAGAGSFLSISGGAVYGLNAPGGATLLLYGEGYSAGQLYVSAGQTISQLDILGGQAEISGTAYATTIASGQQTVASGGTALDSVVLGGVQEVLGSARATSVYAGGTETVETSNGTATGSYIYSGGEQTVYSAGTLFATTVSGGVINIDNQGSSISAIVLGGGSATIDGGTASGTTIGGNGGGTAIVTNGWVMENGQNGPGGETVSTALNAGGTEIISSGGKAYYATVNNGGNQLVEGGTVTGTTVNSGGNLTVGENGSTYTSYDSEANGINILSGGSLTISAGIVSGANIAAGASAVLSPGGQLYLFSNNSANGLVLQGGYFADNGGAISNSVVLGGAITINSGGTAYATSLYGGTQQIYDGTASYSLIHGGATEAVGDGTGTATSISATVSSGAYLELTANGVASGTVLNGGDEINAGGNSYNTIINSGSTEYAEDDVYAGSGASPGTGAFGTTVNSGGVQDVLTYASGTTINNGGAGNVEQGGTASGTIVNSGGQQTVFSGGTAYYTVVNAFGLLSAASGGTTLNAVLSGGTQVVGNGDPALYTSVSNGGLLIVEPDGVVSGAVVYSGGTLLDLPSAVVSDTVSSGGVVISTGVVVLSGNTIVQSAATATGTIVDDNTTLYVLTSGTAANTVVNSGGTECLALGATASGTVLNPGGSIDLPYLLYSSAGAAYIDPTTGLLTISAGSEYYTQQLAGTYSGTVLSANTDYNGGTIVTLDALCYLRGTRILTPTGEKPIETLQIGDKVLTRFNGTQKIKFLGHQNFTPHFLANNPAKWPIKIAAGALGGDVPLRDLYISPGHSMLISKSLVLATSLLNGLTITQPAPTTQIDYIQIELAAHDCVMAEGAWSETFADAPGLRAQFHNAADFWALYPDYQTPQTLTLCAPRPQAGPALEKALAPIIAQAANNLIPGLLEGSIDRLSATRIEGWAMDTAHPHLPILLEVWLGETFIATILACDPRADLAAAQKGNGRHAFALEMPQPLTEAEQKTLKIRRASDHAELTAPQPHTQAA